MLGSKKAKTTIISSDAVLEGTLTTGGMLHVDGHVNGSVNVDGDISVGPEGVIDGEVHGHNATVAGKVHGEVTMRGHLRVLSGGVVSNMVRYETLEVEKGGVLSGQTGNLVDEEEVLAEEDDDDEQEELSAMPVPVGQA